MVRATGSVRLVIDVVARGASGRDGVTIKVEPGSSASGSKPLGEGKTFGPVPTQPTPSSPPTGPSSVPSPAGTLPGAADPAMPVPDTASPTPVHPIKSVGVHTPAPAVQSEPTPAPSVEKRETWATSYPARLGGAGGWETWRFLPARGLNRYYPSGPWTITVTAVSRDGASVTEHATFNLRKETRLTVERARKIKDTRAVRLRGELTRVDPQGFGSYAPFGGQRLEVLYRESSGSSWEKVSTATTRGSGRFAKRVSGRAKGYWRVRFPGTDHYATDQTTPWRIGR